MPSSADREPRGSSSFLNFAGTALSALGLFLLAGWLRESGLVARVSPSLANVAPDTAVTLLQSGLALLLLQRVWKLSRARKAALLGTLALCGLAFGLIEQKLWVIESVVLALTAGCWGLAGHFNRKDAAGRREAKLQQARSRADEAHHHLAAVVDSSEDAIIGLTLDGAMCSWNRTAAKMFGYNLGEVLGRPMLMLVPPDRTEESFEVLKRVARGERVDQLETTRIRKDGTRAHVSTTVTPIKDATGGVIGASAVCRDIKEKSQTEETRARYETILTCSDDAILGETLEGIISSWSPGAQRLYGYTSEAVVGRSVGLLIPPDRAAEVPEILKHIKKGNRVDHYETVRIRKEGDLVHVSLTVSPIFDATGAVISAVSIARDITPRKEMEALLSGRVSQLEAVDKELEAFTYAVSNDLRTPLRSIDGFTQIFLEDYADKLDAAGVEHLQRIRSSCKRMTDLVENMFSLVQVSRKEIRREPVNLSALAHRIAEDLQKTQPGRELEFIIKEGAIAQGDGGLLRIALENLMSNACKFTGTRPKARIEFGVSRDNGSPVYYVKDDGSGFTLDAAQDAFNPAHQESLDDDLEGNRVGLATVRRIIHRHGGRVWAEGQARSGATFYFTL